jgi:hypothetical protein
MVLTDVVAVLVLIGVFKFLFVLGDPGGVIVHDGQAHPYNAQSV